MKKLWHRAIKFLQILVMLPADLFVSLIVLLLLKEIYLCLLIPVFLKIPLWVVQAFVPDVFLTIIVSAVLLLAVGFLKGGILWAHKKTIRTREVSGGGH